MLEKCKIKLNWYDFKFYTYPRIIVIHVLDFIKTALVSKSKTLLLHVGLVFYNGKGYCSKIELYLHILFVQKHLINDI